MTDYITEIPNIQNGVLHTITVCDQEGAISVMKELIIRLTTKYHTSVGYIGLNDNLERLQEDCADLKAVGTVHYQRQKNRNVIVALSRAQGMHNRRFVRAFIVDGADLLLYPGLDRKLQDNPQKVKEELEGFAKRNKIPVIAIITK